MIVTHEFEEAPWTADTLADLREGRLIPVVRPLDPLAAPAAPSR